jgi:hypothetical protein
MRHRKLLFLLLFIVAAALGLVIYRWVAPPPRAVRLLPESNFLLYVNFSPAHFFDLSQLIASQAEPEYQDFVQQTGFHFEKDLDTFAASQRHPGNFDSDSAAIFTGHFDQPRLTGYLRKMATSMEQYADKTIFSIPNQSHTVRVCLVDGDTVAVTNMASADPIHSIIDKARHSSFMDAGPYLAANYYHDVPFASLAWAIFRVPPQSDTGDLPNGIKLDFMRNSTAIVSLRFTGSLRLRAEILSESEAAAAQVKEAADTFLAWARTFVESSNPGGTDKDVKAVFDGIEVQQKGSRTVISVVIPRAFLEKMQQGLKR